ncbi:DNA-directed RNA polymerase subunit beta [Quillaja saponaria]|uniref:DNA-directed RNA polymerase subunit beta n=1 Tax=Quillaja saponaria TaxID=32244 RepID=A0AAD7LRT2_QUISA|nr:DNA-directed RNA polymerase subunit beta [Quillaja saponaria]
MPPFPLPHSQSPRHSHHHPTTKMLERALSSRRATPHSDEDGVSVAGGDESKTKKQHIFFYATNRASYYLSRLGLGHPWPCLIGLFLILVLVSSLIFNSRGFVCISSFDPVSRSRFFGFDGLESDFGSLGVPWCRSKHGKTVEWTSKDLLKGLEEFVPIYETRPIKNNMFGMGFDHSFGLWFIARHPEKYLKKGPAYVDGNCTYFAGKDFVDFGSVDWEKVMKKHGITDLSRVLIFFDDHQNELKRIQQALKAGFRHLVFEDNYDTGTGDHYSLRQICDQSYIRGD